MHSETVELKYIMPVSGRRKWIGVAEHDRNEIQLTVYPNYIPFIRDYYPELEAINKIGKQSSMGIDIVLSHRGSLIVMDGLWTKEGEIVMYTEWRDERQGRVNSLQEPPSLPARRKKAPSTKEMDDAIFPTNKRDFNDKVICKLVRVQRHVTRTGKTTFKGFTDSEHEIFIWHNHRDMIATAMYELKDWSKEPDAITELDPQPVIHLEPNDSGYMEIALVEPNPAQPTLL